jgi:hypothetical protein
VKRLTLFLLVAAFGSFSIDRAPAAEGRWRGPFALASERLAKTSICTKARAGLPAARLLLLVVQMTITKLQLFYKINQWQFSSP